MANRVCYTSKTLNHHHHHQDQQLSPPLPKANSMASDDGDVNMNIPMEIITDILVRLPVKPLSRFKCVSKTWYNLIHSQDFLKLHFNKSLKPPDSFSNNSSIILPITRTVRIDDHTTIVPGLYRAYLNPNQTRLEITKLTLPRSLEPSQFQARFGVNVVGSCNGLILIVSGMSHIVVCNPAIEPGSAYKFLPSLTHLVKYYNTNVDDYRRPYVVDYQVTSYLRIGRVDRRFSHQVFGFGYDSIGFGYKIVYLSPQRALIYSMARDGGRNSSWRTTDLPDFILSGVEHYRPEETRVLMKVHGHGFVANNHLHWHITEYDPEVYGYSREAILSFDLHNEEWGEVPVPDELAQANKRCYDVKGCLINKSYIIELGVLDGCLCLLISGGISCPRNLELWIMKEYGVKESWTRLFNVPNGSGIPLCYLKDRFEFLMPGVEHGLGWFNPRDNKFRKVEFHGYGFSGENYYSNKVRICSESFVHPFTSMVDVSL